MGIKEKYKLITMKAIIALLLIATVTCYPTTKLGIPKNLCGPAAAAAEAICAGAIDCATSAVSGFKIPDNLKDEMVDKVTSTIMGKIGCPKRRLFSIGKTISSIAKKAGSVVKDVACSVVKANCSPACSAAVTTLTTAVAAYGIPASCASSALTKACESACAKACK